jgi:hypothetical protein
MTKSKGQIVKRRCNRKKNLMAEEKNEKDASCDTCNQASSCTQEEKETQVQETQKSIFPHNKHRLGSRMIPEWMERWALGD